MKEVNHKFLLGLDGVTAHCIIAEAVIGKQPNPQPFVERPEDSCNGVLASVKNTPCQIPIFFLDVNFPNVS